MFADRFRSSEQLGPSFDIQLEKIDFRQLWATISSRVLCLASDDPEWSTKSNGPYACRKVLTNRERRGEGNDNTKSITFIVQ